MINIGLTITISLFFVQAVTSNLAHSQNNIKEKSLFEIVNRPLRFFIFNGPEKYIKLMNDEKFDLGFSSSNINDFDFGVIFINNVNEYTGIDRIDKHIRKNRYDPGTHVSIREYYDDINYKLWIIFYHGDGDFNSKCGYMSTISEIKYEIYSKTAKEKIRKCFKEPEGG
ncbi:MAG: hypothetical protein AAGF28_10240 [Pseudomonadota bacterium]